MAVKKMSFTGLTQPTGLNYKGTASGLSPTGSRFGERRLARFLWNLLLGFAIALHEIVGSAHPTTPE